METSIVIRTKNEQKWIGKVLQRLSEQTYKDFEIIIVDSGSTDKTLEIARAFNVKFFQIRTEEFSYPYALNFGCEKASGSKYFVFLSAHSLPLSKNWLANGLKNFANEKVMGVYGMMQALPDGSFWEKFFWHPSRIWFPRIFGYKRIIHKSGMGVMGFTHAIVRRDLWEEHHFDESYGMGGEDGEWAGYWFARGYVAVKDARFSVAHSHGLSLKDLKKQKEHWESLGKPQPFQRQDYRK